MKKAFLSLIIFVPFLLMGQDTATRQGIREISLSGEGYELGYQHGKMLKEEISVIVGKWKEHTKKTFNEEPDVVLEKFMNYAGFTESIRKWAPELLDEIKGIAEGSGQPFNNILVLNLMDEFWVYKEQLDQHHCSGLGIPAQVGYPSVIAQNMDIEDYTDGYQVILRLAATEDRPEQLILTLPGVIALNGMNSTGVGVCVNTLMQLNANNHGLPVAFIVRKIIGFSEKKQIMDLLIGVRHASGQNYLLGIHGEIIDLEASANKVVRFRPANPNGSVTHTNHPLANTDFKPYYTTKKPPEEGKVPVFEENSLARFQAVNARIGVSPGITLGTIKSALRSKDDKDNPVCRANSNSGSGFTFASVVMVLSGTPLMLVTAGPPDESEYQQVEFSPQEGH